MKILHHKNTLNLFLITLLILFAGCNFPGSNKDANRIRLTIQNTLTRTQKNIPINLSLERLKTVKPDFTLKAFSVVSGEAPQEAMIPAQADDLDYDGKRDQLSFLLDFESQETKEISILYDPNVQATFTLEVKKQSRAGIFPELNATGAIESDLMAYVLNSNGSITPYGKKRNDLFSVDSMFQNELDYNEQLTPELRQHFESNKIQISQNPQAIKINSIVPEFSWVIHDFENQEDYYIRKSDEKLNLYKSIGLSINKLLNDDNISVIPLISKETIIGSGGYALYNKVNREYISLDKQKDYVRILANGGMRSIIQRVIPEMGIAGEQYKITINSFIYGKNTWIKQNILLNKQLPPEINLVVGIPKIGSEYGIDEELQFIWSWGTDPNNSHPLGYALFYEETFSDQVIDIEPSILSLSIKPNEIGPISYRVLTIWDGGINTILTKTEFLQYLKNMRTNMENEPTINFILGEEK
ncbi:DUF4861 family protein [Candidatus Poribacteria bacterium]|nr:DUF4861 family protein [Candidatus Poribacteria bacterium]